MPGKPGRSGRPPKLTQEQPSQTPDADNQEKPPRKRGRPAKQVEGDIPETPYSAVNIAGESAETAPTEIDQQSPGCSSSTVEKPNLRLKTGRELFKDSTIGKPADILPVTTLPVKRLILQRARALRCQSKTLSDRDIAHTIALEVEKIWDRAAIPCQRVDFIQESVLKCMQELGSLLKHWQRLQQDKEPLKTYLASLEELFDVSYTDLRSRMASSRNPNWEEDYQFYLNQKRVPQVGSMVGLDVLLEKRSRKQQVKKAQKEKQKEKAEAAAATAREIATPSDTNSESQDEQ